MRNKITKLMLKGKFVVVECFGLKRFFMAYSFGECQSLPRSQIEKVLKWLSFLTKKKLFTDFKADPDPGWRVGQGACATCMVPGRPGNVVM